MFLTYPASPASSAQSPSLRHPRSRLSGGGVGGDGAGAGVGVGAGSDGAGAGDGGLSRHPRSHPPRHPRSLLSGGGDGAGSVGAGAGDGADGAGNGDSDNADVIRAHIDIDNRAHAGAHYQAHVAVYESGITRRIGAGENRGRTLKHDFVVRHWSAPLFIRQGKNQTQVEVVIPADWHRPNLGLAVIIQNRRTFATLQSLRTPLARLFSG